MTTWQILVAAGISVLVGILTNWLTSILSRPSPRVALLSAAGAFALAALGLWLTNPPTGDPCAAIKGRLEPFGTTAAQGDVKTFGVQRNGGDGRDLVYDWSATRGLIRPGLNSNSPQAQYQAPTDYVGEDTVRVHVRAPGCGERGAATWTATVVVVEAVTMMPPTHTPPSSPTPTNTPTRAAPSPTPTLPPGAEGVRDKDKAVMVFVPAGTFTMGSTPEQIDAALALCLEIVGEQCQRDWFSDEEPSHDVTLDAFWLDRFEVTNFQYAQCVNAGECETAPYATDTDYNGQNQPVVGVSWQDAANYCAWAGARLPSEAEWEYAARGPESRLYPWGNEFDGSRLNFCDASCQFDWKDIAVNDGYALTAPVGNFPGVTSWVGAMDMAGNVWEWVNDWYQSDYYTRFVSHNPPGPTEEESDGTKVLRGGAWLGNRNGVRCANRYGGVPHIRDNDVGFRCASTSS